MFLMKYWFYPLYIYIYIPIFPSANSRSVLFVPRKPLVLDTGTNQGSLFPPSSVQRETDPPRTMVRDRPYLKLEPVLIRVWNTYINLNAIRYVQNLSFLFKKHPLPPIQVAPFYPVKKENNYNHALILFRSVPQVTGNLIVISIICVQSPLINTIDRNSCQVTYHQYMR